MLLIMSLLSGFLLYASALVLEDIRQQKKLKK